uniref:Uncharacterized protein n=1 Tax=Oryza rufipogon TaxID=4529 RepID=A0A0E0NSM6_ORYRU
MAGKQVGSGSSPVVAHGKDAVKRAARRMANVAARAAMVMRDSSRTVTTRPKVVGLVRTQRALVQIFMLKDPMVICWPNCPRKSHTSAMHDSRQLGKSLVAHIS